MSVHWKRCQNDSRDLFGLKIFDRKFQKRSEFCKLKSEGFQRDFSPNKLLPILSAYVQLVLKS